MADLTTDPLLTTLTQSLADGDHAALGPTADCLQELDATLGDVLWWYAVGPPDWLAPTYTLDEARRQVLACWLRCVEPGVPAPVHPADAGKAACTLMERWALVEGARLDWRNLGNSYLCWRREQKRRVLALFPEVSRDVCWPGVNVEQKLVYQEVPDPDHYGQTLVDPICERVDFFLDGCFICSATENNPVRINTDSGYISQVLAAPDWIEETGPRGGRRRRNQRTGQVRHG